VSARSPLQGDELPRILTPPPGPKSRASVKRLRRVESPAIWGKGADPIVWSRGRGAVIEDLDGNRYLDLTSGFGAVSLGHAAPEVARAVARQGKRLAQGLGDLTPNEAREKLVRTLSKLGGALSRVLLASTGSEAVELALKTAAIATTRRRFVAFSGGYHGDSYGALEATQHPEPPAAIRAQRSGRAIHIPYPCQYRCSATKPCAAVCDRACFTEGLAAIDRALGGEDPPGAILVEPIQGRAGAIVPPAWFLPELCGAARARGLLVIYDEVMTGACRTGPFWAWERSGPEAEPDLLCAGKGLGGGVAIAAVFSKRKWMDRWSAVAPASGEAPHASTFYGHPLACAGALAALRVLTARGFRERVEARGRDLAEGLARVASRHPSIVGEVRSAGLLGAIEFVRDRDSREPAPDRAKAALEALLARGVLAIPGGIHGNVISLLPPLTITEEQLRYALDQMSWGM